MDNKTIYALSTVYGKSGIAVIRISGIKALEAVKKLTNLDTVYLKPRQAYLALVYDITKQNIIDKSLIIYYAAPASFSGEDCVEIHCHGSKAVIAMILDSLSSLEDFRMAEPGEFSKRAFYNHKMDLTEAEGLADLIDAETMEQQKFAIRQMQGTLKNLYEGWREQLLQIYAYLEAYIDFPDEDIPEDKKESCLNGVFKLIKEIDEHLQSSRHGERLREGFRVVITGPTNAGKSSLLNAIVKRNAVIVSEIAGTTRDAVEVNLDLKGYPVILTDTAGLRDADDSIEKQGIAIAKEKIANADLIIALFDAQKDDPQIFADLIKESADKIIFVANKSDALSLERCSKLQSLGCLVISAKNNQGVVNLLDHIAEKISSYFNSGSSLIITRQRYREALIECRHNLQKFNFDKEIELSVEDIRLAARALGKITGRIEVEEILNKIFSTFCLGK